MVAKNTCPQCGSTKYKIQLNAIWKCQNCDFETETFPELSEWWCFKEIERLENELEQQKKS